MLILSRFEGKTLGEAFQKCLEQLNCLEEEIYYKQREEETGKIFKSKKIIIEAIKKEEVIEFIKQFIKSLASNMNMAINFEIREKEDVITVLLVSDNNAILIGKEGRTLNAIQMILKQVISNQLRMPIKITVDASNYKSKKIKNLEYEVKKICSEVLNSKIEVKLDAMNSFERRLVHSIVTEYPNLKSISIGEEPERYTVISYKES